MNFVLGTGKNEFSYGEMKEMFIKWKEIQFVSAIFSSKIPIERKNSIRFSIHTLLQHFAKTIKRQMAYHKIDVY